MFATEILYSIAISVLLAFSDAAAIPGLQERGDGALKLDFQVLGNRQANLNSTASNRIVSRDNSHGLTLQNKGYYYVADIFVGSDGQKVSVDVDTGSSDLWVIDSDSGVTGTYGVYDHSSSSTYKYVASGFQIGYGDGSQASGNWVKDTVALSSGGPSIKNFEFGDATSTYQLNYGILGIGKAANEAASTQYVNFPQALKNAGLINKNAYSLYLNSPDAESGSVLFGGIDYDKIDGDLVTLPITSLSELTVAANSITAGGKDFDLSGLNLLLDSGTTLTYLPPTIVKEIASSVGATNKGDYYGWDSCDDVVGYTFNFNGISIEVPKEDAGGKITLNDGSEANGCALFIFPEDDYYILGDNFLRHSYIVYNLDDDEISLGQVKYSDSESITVIQ